MHGNRIARQHNAHENSQPPCRREGIERLGIGKKSQPEEKEDEKAKGREEDTTKGRAPTKSEAK